MELQVTEQFNYKDICRICLKPSKYLVQLFKLSFPKEDLEVISFLRKITDLKFPESDNLPSTICANCEDQIFSTYEFVQLCCTSESILRTKETRRILREIEDEALQEDEVLKPEPVKDQSDCENQNIENSPNTKILEDTKEKYKCELCCLVFGNKTKYRKHQTSHDGLNAFKCGLCLQTFSKQKHLNVHMRSHVEDESKKFSCKTCGHKFMYEYLLKRHQLKHSDPKPYPCPKCNKGCLTAESFKRHLKIHDKNYAKKTHICNICNKSFLYPSFLAEHMKNHTGERPHLCSICGKGFRQNGALHFHQRIHTGYKPFKCEICNKNFMSQSILKVHMRKHTNERPYVCCICGKAFRVSTDLKTHNRTHTEEKPVLCTICGKKMSTTGQLTVHLRSHTGEKPYSCSICDKSFTTKTILTKHQRIHTGERPYRCEICGRGFTQNSTLRNHLKMHKPKGVKGENI